MISFSQGLWRLPSRDRGECDPERGKPDQASDHHHPAGHREAPPLGSQLLYLIFFVNSGNIFFWPVFNCLFVFFGTYLSVHVDTLLG